MLIAFLLLQTAAVTEPPATLEKPTKAEKKVCRKSGSTGTRLGGAQVCRTAAEWAAEDSARQRAADQMRAESRRN